ncbi:MAG: response regulator, partial [Proteobacteria bacterium]|nr:response regulator [Pseudomonadota bacterium]
MKKILIIDSDENLLNSLAQDMIAAGYEPIAVPTAQEGISHASEASLIIIAVELSDQNGFVTCGTIKRNPETAHIPVIITSSAASTAEFERHYNLPVHAERYYFKPLDIPALLQDIQMLIDGQDGVQYDENGN